MAETTKLANSLQVGPPERINGKQTLWGAFSQHRRDAKKRGIDFLFTFKKWLKVWEKSGHLHERGCRKGQYVMARHGDVGPYSSNNVMIVTSGQNHYDGNIGRSNPMSEIAKLKISKAMKGKKLTEAHKKAIGNGTRGKLKGVPKSEEHRRKISESRKGMKIIISKQHRKKLSVAGKKRWKKWRILHA